MEQLITEEKTSLELSLQQTTAELQTVQQTLRTLEKRAEEDRRRKDSIIKDAEHYIKKLETKMQDQEMHLKKEMEEEMSKFTAQKAETEKLKEQCAEDDGRRKDSILTDAGLYIDELKTKMQDQEMHLRKEMEERGLELSQATARAPWMP
uniref:Uncharacterized protein n=1 Tax=Knipowitschia caucasica TaxID=637954 RepID=A0AAV2KA33_KNICA